MSTSSRTPLRVKSTWFRPGRPKTPEAMADALAFISWRVAQNMLKSMRKADFDIDPGPQYFDFLAEALAFAIQVAWRLAHPRYDEAGRIAFMTELAHRTGDELAENRPACWATSIRPPSRRVTSNSSTAVSRNTPRSATARRDRTSPSTATSRACSRS